MSEFEHEDILHEHAEVLHLPRKGRAQANWHDVNGYGDQDPRSKKPQPLEDIDFLDLPDQEGKPIPPRRWLVDDMVPIGQITMISGAGGLGKSLIAMQLATACATGRPYLAKTATRCPAISIHCEDSKDELRGRQAEINTHYDLSWSDLSDLHPSSREGKDNLLMHVDKYGKMQKPTEFYGQIQEAARKWGARLIILDSLYDIFGGNENIRPEVRKFALMLKQLALEIDGAVVVLAHPSVGGLNDGSGRSGSTAWDASVRSRLYLTRPEAEEDRDIRELRTMKANYSGLERPLRLRWQNGVFINEGGGGGYRSAYALAEIDHAVIQGVKRLMTDGARIAAALQSTNRLDSLFRKYSICTDLTTAELRASADRLLEKGTLERATVGPASKRVILLRPPGMKYPDEGQEEMGV